MDADILVLSVRDEGVGTAGSMPSDGCGLGLDIIARMFPDFTLADGGPGTRVTIRAPPPTAGPSQVDGFCDDVAVEREREQERELRRWAVALADAGAADRRAMGRAILMLLDRIDSLRAELERRPPRPTPSPRSQSPVPSPSQSPDAEAGPMPRTPWSSACASGCVPLPTAAATERGSGAVRQAAPSDPRAARSPVAPSRRVVIPWLGCARVERAPSGGQPRLPRRGRDSPGIRFLTHRRRFRM